MAAAGRAHAQAATHPLNPATTASVKAGLSKANSLEVDGKAPFHLKLKVRLYDRKESVLEEGLVEYWWAGAAGAHLNLTSSSLGIMHGGGLWLTQRPGAERSYYLMSLMLNEERFGGETPWPANEDITDEGRREDKSTLQCLYQTAKVHVRFREEMCLDSGSARVRSRSDGYLRFVRTRTGEFAGTHTGLAVDLFCGHTLLARATVETLEPFSPEGSTIPLEGGLAKLTNRAAPTEVEVPREVMAARRIGVPGLIFSPDLRVDDLGGIVIVLIKVTEEGSIASLVPIASPDRSLTEAATDAIRRWRYRPYLVDGLPVEVTTTVAVPFNLHTTI